MTEHILSMIGLAKKAGQVAIGEEPVGAAARAKDARVILVAQDAAPGSVRRAMSFGQAGACLCLTVPFDKDRLGRALGRTSCAMAAVTDIGFAEAIVKKLAALAKESGIDGTVSSPYEAREIREMNGPDFLIVTPGIRPSFAVADDQKRFTTPSQALHDGASHLVIGRPITKAADPACAADKILEEIQEV